jgi:hypothetical protein
MSTSDHLSSASCSVSARENEVLVTTYKIFFAGVFESRSFSCLISQTAGRPRQPKIIYRRMAKGLEL